MKSERKETADNLALAKETNKTSLVEKQKELIAVKAELELLK